jgi:Fic family protein
LPNGRATGGQYFNVDFPMAHSDAWRSLSGAAAKVWVELRTRYHGNNNGQLRLSLEDGARVLGLGKSTARRALLELEAKGFIRKTRQGQFYG